MKHIGPMGGGGVAGCLPLGRERKATGELSSGTLVGCYLPMGSVWQVQTPLTACSPRLDHVPDLASGSVQLVAGGGLPLLLQVSNLFEGPLGGGVGARIWKT